LRQVLKGAWSLVSTRPESMASLKSGWKDLEHLVLSWAAMVSRQLGSRAILIVGLGASAYAGFLYFADQIAPSSTSASHDAVLKARWASPKPSPNIVIVDIDERSLAALAPEPGRSSGNSDECHAERSGQEQPGFGCGHGGDSGHDA
jgi:hypothetical protein